MPSLGKLLFPGRPRDERRRRLRQLAFAIGVGLVSAALATGFILLEYRLGHPPR